MGVGEKELQGKIAGARRVRKMAYAGLVLGVTAFVVGLLLQFSLLFLVGYTVFIVCTGISSFVTVLIWQYNRALKARIESKETVPSEILCPRCGTRINGTEKYCQKCGKQVQTRKR